jgi:methionine-rich copper-binding protein CopC
MKGTQILVLLCLLVICFAWMSVAQDSTATATTDVTGSNVAAQQQTATVAEDNTLPFNTTQDEEEEQQEIIIEDVKGVKETETDIMYTAEERQKTIGLYRVAEKDTDVQEDVKSSEKAVVTTDVKAKVAEEILVEKYKEMIITKMQIPFAKALVTCYSDQTACLAALDQVDKEEAELQAQV